MDEERFLEGKVALITGAARGQGRACAVLLAQHGANIIAVDACRPIGDFGFPPSTPEDLDETARLVEAAGGAISKETVDVRDLNLLDRVVKDGVERFGRLDVVHANAGISDWGTVWELEPRQWQDMIDVNLTGVWHTMKVAIPHMIEADHGGSIVLTSSVSGIKALPGQAHYAAAKHGLVGLANSAALELGEFGIRVNTLHPYAVNTLMAQDGRLSGVLRQHPNYAPSFPASRLPDLRMAEPEDIAQAVLFLVSDAARCITGAQVPVDLGVLKV